MFLKMGKEGEQTSLTVDGHAQKYSPRVKDLTVSRVLDWIQYTIKAPLSKRFIKAKNIHICAVIIIITGVIIQFGPGHSKRVRLSSF